MFIDQDLNFHNQGLINVTRVSCYIIIEQGLMLLYQGLMLHYRSKRRGFTTYTAGQLKAVAQTYFKTEMGIEVILFILMILIILGLTLRIRKTKNTKR